MIKPDSWIARMAREYKMIEPFEEKQVKTGISYGLSSYGYDMRLSDEFRIFSNAGAGVIDPKNMGTGLYTEVKATNGYVVLPPHSLTLAKTVEYFRIPRNVLTIAFGKSTYSRCGVLVNITPFEPEWEGFVTLGISNTSPLPVKLYANEGIAQVLFFESDQPCAVSYADRKGKYQAQQHITLPKI